MHLVSRLNDTGKLGLDIGHIRSSDNSTLATMGRGGADILLEGATISKIQCSFEINLDTNVIMFYDRSHSQTSQVFGEDAEPFATPFEYGRPRKVVVQEGLNPIIGMGGKERNLFKFRLKWHCTADDAIQKIKNRGSVAFEENPRFAQTIDETDTVLPSRMETRIHTPRPQQLRIRYAKIGALLGRGKFGEVYKVVDADSGRLMAVKLLKRPASTSQDWRTFYITLKREVETLSNIDHVSVTYFQLIIL
jgi:hypothetical protein